MKKLLTIILLFLFTFNNVFASSQYSKSDRIYRGIGGAFKYLIMTRKMGSSDPAVVAKRKEAESLLKEDFNGQYRNQVLAAYKEVRNEAEEGLKQDKLSGDQNEIRMCIECINEIDKIAKVIGIK